MSTFSPEPFVLPTFIRLRGSGFKLGVGEYMAALKSLEGGFGSNEQDLEDTLKLLWCHSVREQTLFDQIWRSVQAQISSNKRPKPPFPGLRKVGNTVSDVAESFSEQEKHSPQSVATPTKQSEQAIGSVPVQAPESLLGNEEPSTLQAYYPISRRMMVYCWRYLRRPVATGPLNRLDIAATIHQVTQQGFYLAPVYGREERNDARLIMLIDQNGSMTPFHHFTRDLVETVRIESRLLPENINVYYFQNIPGRTVYKDVYLTEPLSLSELLGKCDSETSVLIVSDAGSARGYRIRERVRGTIQVLYELKQCTNLIAWLNPMPAKRWVGSSAEILASSVPMYQMDNEGLGNAIDVVRGQTLKHVYSVTQ